jgi:hypothetical protein
MSFNISRRSFLQSLIALGANYALSSNATPQEVTKSWKEALAQPWYFSVDEYGTITEPDYPQQETWGEIFNICGRYLRTPKDVISEVRGCQPLICHFQTLAQDELESLVEELDSLDSLSAPRRRHLTRLIAAIQDDPDDGWRDWVRLEGKAGIERFKEEITEWENEPADYLKIEWFPSDYGAQGQAMVFFESLGHQMLKALGVVIVEGEHPGSSYYAAELRNDIELANETAADLELPFRFKNEGT